LVADINKKQRIINNTTLYTRVLGNYAEEYGGVAFVLQYNTVAVENSTFSGRSLAQSRISHCFLISILAQMALKLEGNTAKVASVFHVHDNNEFTMTNSILTRNCFLGKTACCFRQWML